MANVFDESDNSLIELSQILDFRQVKRVSSARPKQPTAAPMDGKKPGPPQLGRGRRLRKLAPPSSGPLHASFSIQSGKKNALDKRHEPKVAHVEDKNYSKLLRNTKTEVDGSRNTSGTLSMTSLSPRARKFPSSYGDSEVESEDHMSDFIVDDSCDSEWDEDPPSLLRQSPSKKNQLLSSIPSIYPPKRTASGGESAKYLDPRREDKRSSARASTPPSNLPRMIPTLTSPKKLPRIPQSPHRQSSDAFWSQATMNDWNQEYSPKKKLDEAVQSRPASPSKAIGKESAKSMLERKRDFNSKKVALAEEFLKELDCTVAAGQVQELTRTSGGVRIVWSKTLNTTAGRANWKRVALKSSSDQAAANNAIKSKTTYQHIASIELAEKVIDDEDRLLNVLAHEYCHLANFMISGVRTNPHGKEFKEWASKCTKAFSHLNVRVTTKHTYAIAYKYIWQCTSCRVEFKRHSKSIDPVRHACGVCKAKLEQIKPLPRKTAPSQYQLFVKERYKSVQDANPTSPRKDIMGLVAKEYKASRANVGAKDDDIIASRPASKDDADMLHDVMRKLDFVNLLDDWMN